MTNPAIRITRPKAESREYLRGYKDGVRAVGAVMSCAYGLQSFAPLYKVIAKHYAKAVAEKKA